MLIVQHKEGTLREITAHMSGMETRESKSPAETWDIINSDPSVELLLCQVMESIEDGLIERVAQNFPDIPIVVLGIRPPQVFAMAMHRGAFDYLPVPFTREELEFTLGVALEYRRIRMAQQSPNQACFGGWRSA